MDLVREDRIVNNMGLINKVIGDRIIYNSDNYDDIFQIGCIGLIKAVDTFDESRNIMFSTYAYKVIHTEILNYLKLKENRVKHVSLNTTMVNFNNNDNDDISLIDVIKDEKCGIEEDYINIEERLIINRLIKRVRLSDKCKFIILLYYGFYNNRKYTRRQLANIFSVSPTYVGEVINKFIREMDRLIRIEYGRDFIINQNKRKICTRKY